MSLHLGNLSSRVRRDELERVFQRFGRCKLQVKDKFGFVVYDFHADAEKAMRAFRGKNICGEPITLSWSNKQPGGPVQRFAGGGRFFESQRSRRDYKVGLKQTGGDSRRFKSTGLIDEATSHNIKGVIGEKKDRKVREDFPDEGDRWGERVGNITNENGVANGMEFDRYEPYHGNDVKDEDHVTHSGGSPALEKSQERRGIDQIGEIRLNHLGNAKLLQTCYNCGELGHKMRNCPQENGSKDKTLSRFDFMRENEMKHKGRGEPGPKRSRSTSRGKHKSDRETPSLRRHPLLPTSRHSPIAEETHRSVSKEYVEKKRSRRETGSPERQRAKKSRALSKSSTLSSRSSSHSKYRSVSPRSGSPSSSSRSSSTSHHPRSGGSKFKSRSRSRENFPSVSVGRGPLQSSPNKLQINQKGSLLNAASLEFKEVLVERDAGSDTSKLDIMTVDEGIDKDNYQRDDDNHGYTSEVKNSGTLENDRLTTGSLSRQSLTEKREVSVRSHIANSLNITSEELSMVLKHYGLEHPEGNEKGLSAETYFGSARLWPWEIIYYRRHKKGLISTENYARRIAQNKEFGIVDKYIRSSSGWGELGHDNS